ncbi:hypothetical protein N657DRAFT_308164 [Parathielavia appendiculata]|uniref:Uncharacterized protein n=1 Tax=Parathielavia appendiculata TaxID=2587402 RepID=A0AAN6Z5Y6_9PEZI|nr:hypothetical protein N657DRAFT_308164 [Parathielavia appendiculata]
MAAQSHRFKAGCCCISRPTRLLPFNTFRSRFQPHGSLSAFFRPRESPTGPQSRLSNDGEQRTRTTASSASQPPTRNFRFAVKLFATRLLDATSSKSVGTFLRTEHHPHDDAYEEADENVGHLRSSRTTLFDCFDWAVSPLSGRIWTPLSCSTTTRERTAHSESVSFSTHFEGELTTTDEVLAPGEIERVDADEDDRWPFQAQEVPGQSLFPPSALQRSQSSVTTRSIPSTQTHYESVSANNSSISNRAWRMATSSQRKSRGTNGLLGPILEPAFVRPPSTGLFGMKGTSWPACCSIPSRKTLLFLPR